MIFSTVLFFGGIFITVFSVFFSKKIRDRKSIQYYCKTGFEEGYDIESFYGKAGEKYILSQPEEEQKKYYEKLLKNKEKEAEFLQAIKEEETC